MKIQSPGQSRRSSVRYVADEQTAWFIAGGFTAGDAAVALRLVTTHQPSWQDLRYALRRSASIMLGAS